MPDSDSSATFGNPITFGNIPDLLAAVLNVVIIISIPVIVFFLIFAGFQYVTARGNPDKLQTAHTSLLYGIIGGVIILSSVTIITIVKSLVSAFGA